MLYKDIKVKTTMLKYRYYEADTNSNVKKIDVVVNNYHGVNNSKLLEKIADN